MCGIAGVMSTTLSDHEIGNFQNLMAMSVMRGWNGSGIIAVGKHVHQARYSGTAAELMISDRFNGIIKTDRPRIIVGHARWPTKGDATLKNTHPHRHKHIIGVHNGTLYKVNDKAIDNNQSDSAALFHSFAENGVEETLDKTTGAMALVWVDEIKGTLNFFRNNQRPLWFAQMGWNNNVSTLYWASDPDYLRLVLRSVKDVPIKQLPELQWYEFPLKVKGSIQASHIYDRRPEEPVVPVYRYNQGHNTHDYRSHTHHHNTNMRDESVVPFRGRQQSSRPSVPEIGLSAAAREALRDSGVAGTDRGDTTGDGGSPRSVGPTHTLLTQDGRLVPKASDTVLAETIRGEGGDLAHRVHRFLAQGCAWCSDATLTADSELVPMDRATKFVCTDCAENSDVLPFLAPGQGTTTARRMFHMNH